MDSFRFTTYRRWRGIVEPRSLVENEVQDLVEDKVQIQVEDEVQGLFGVIGLRESVEVFASAPTSDQAISSAKTVQTSWPGSACTATSKLPFFIGDKT